jgi:ubiquinone/menaquinone biosynthesis C-methylase UbiE
MATNKDFYENGSAKWGYKEGLTRSEFFLLERFAPKSKILEAGTAGGRLLYALSGMGRTELAGFDYFASHLEIAKRRVGAADIDFRLMEARNLPYEDESFNGVLYLQQILSNLENAIDRNMVV